MLVLTRKENQRIFIGENICLTIVAIERDRIRIGIEAPREVPIWREELMPRDQKEKRA